MRNRHVKPDIAILTDRAFGPGHPNVAGFYQSLSLVYRRAGRLAEAQEMVRQQHDIQRRFVPETHLDVREIYGDMAERYRLEGRDGEAEKYARVARPGPR
jgi:hypothetical protein